LRTIRLASALILLSLAGPIAARAQQVDVAFGATTLAAPGASEASGNHFPQSLTGGFYPNFSGDVLFFHHFGVGASVSWRASRSLYQNLVPYRPVLYDFNAVFAPPLGHRVQPEFQAGLGAESVRFYTGTLNCNLVSCTNYVSSNHFLGHFAVGLRYYVWGHVFVRPEAHLYLVNNNQEFSSARAVRFGISLGYTLGPSE
jgi:hypothetical protein